MSDKLSVSNETNGAQPRPADDGPWGIHPSPATKAMHSPHRSPRISLISPLPAGQNGEPESGVGQYLVEILERLSDHFEVTVIAGVNTHYRRIGHATIVPVWTPDSRCVYQILRALRSLRPDLIHLQHEFNLYGGLVPTSLLTGTLAAGRAVGRPIVTTIHGIVDKSAITPGFLARNDLPIWPLAARASLALAYRTMTAASSKVIVHHEYFRSVLRDSYGVDGTKVAIIPFGCEDQSERPPTVTTRHRSGTTILVFGFLTGYKMPELVVQLAEERLLPDAAFQFCVGRNPRATSAEYYKRYSDLADRVHALGSCATWSGYVPDEKLAEVFSSSDVVVLPYTECLSGSAVASLAQAYGVSVCYSRSLRPLFGPSSAEFELNTRSLARAISATQGRIPDQTTERVTWAESANRNEQVWADAVSCS